MSTLGRTTSNPLNGQDDNFTYTIIIFAIVCHVSIIAIILYFACCRNKKCCVCEIHISNIPDNETSEEEASDNNILPQDNIQRSDVEAARNPASENLVESNESVSIRIRPTQQVSFIARIRARAQRARHTERGSDSSSPNDSVEGHTNTAAEFDEHGLPSYEAYMERLPSWYVNMEAGMCEEEKPPAYEDVMKQKADR